MARVARVEAFAVAMPYGDRRQSTIVRVSNADGLTGWGEATGECVAEIASKTGPELQGRDWEWPEELPYPPDSSRAARAATDIACWDLWCRIRGVPLAHALGGTRTAVVATARLTRESTIESLLATVNRHVGGGYTSVTLKIRPGWDIEPMREVRRAYPALAIHVDAAATYEETDLETLEALDAYHPITIERPFAPNDVTAHAQLQRHVAAAVVPEISDLHDLITAIDAKAGRAAVLRSTALGGLTSARGAHDRAMAAGWDVAIAQPRGSGIARAAAVALASLPGCTLPSGVADIPASVQVISPLIRASGGVVAVPLTQPGLGHDVDDDAVRRRATHIIRVG